MPVDASARTRRREVADDAYVSVIEALKRTNELLPVAERVELASGSVLSGDGSTLESLSLVNLALFLEEEVSRRMQLDISVLELIVEATGRGGALTVEGLAVALRGSQNP
jgi:hypothetical protein